MHSSHVSNSTSTAASTNTTTTITFSGVSQPESAAGQRQQGSFVGLSTTVHTPESTRISSNYYHKDEQRLLSDIVAPQIDPFKALATHLAVTFEDDDQRQSASSLSLSDEPSRSQKLSQPPVDDVAPIVREEQRPHPTDKWIMMSGNKKRPFQCGHEGCGRKYSKKEYLQTHFVTHTGDSKLRCYQGECAGTVIYRDARALTRHIHSYHTFVRMFGCKFCDRRFRQQHHLKYHMEYVHPREAEKKSPKPQSISESSSATTTTNTANTASTSTINFKVSQPELAAGQRQQGSYVVTSTTIDTPESMPIASYHQQDGLKLLAEVSTSQINPFTALATHQTVTFDDEAVTKEIAGVPNLPSDQYQAEQSPDPTDTNKWIIVDESQDKPYRCGYPKGCDKSYLRKHCLIRHFVKHTGTSKFKCPYPECVGNEYFGDTTLLKRHIAKIHTLDRPFQCGRCKKRFTRKDSLKYHWEHVPCLKNGQKSAKGKKK